MSYIKKTLSKCNEKRSVSGSHALNKSILAASIAPNFPQIKSVC